jgi:regulator of RNase E activity RraA
MAGLCRAAGVTGAVVDGFIRDTDEARMLDFPMYSKAVGPRSTHTPGSQRMEPMNSILQSSAPGVQLILEI